MILVSDDIDVYLVDFGFARIGQGEVGVSSVVKWTLGFMPPEQIFNRQLTPAADLYGLGITLICLLTNTKSADVGDLIDITYRINFRSLLPNLSMQWLGWLEKMVEPRVKDRFQTAAIALSSLPQEIVFAPQAWLSTSTLSLENVPCGTSLMRDVHVHNSVPHTQLHGRWSVVPHPSDPKMGGTHSWISFSPQEFCSNDITCEIWIDTTRLMLGRTYSRELCLETNAAHPTYRITVQLQTKPVANPRSTFPYKRLGVLWGGAIAGTWILGLSATVISAMIGITAMSMIGVAAGIVIGLEVAAGLLALSGSRDGASAGGLGGIVSGIFVLALVAISPINGVGLAGLVGIIFGLLYGVIAGLGVGTLAEQLTSDGVRYQVAIALALLVVGWGSSLGLGLAIGFTSPIVGLLVGILGLPLLAIVAYHPIHRLIRRNQSRSRMHYLIKP